MDFMREVAVESMAKAIDEFKRAHALDEAQGEHYRLFDVIGVNQQEVRIIPILASVIDAQKHALYAKNILCDLICEPFNIDKNSIMSRPYTVRTEKKPLGIAADRVDIEIRGDGFLVFIESKINAAETNNQLERYSQDFHQKAMGGKGGVLFLTKYGTAPKRSTLIQNTSWQRTGGTPADKHFYTASWREVERIISRYCRLPLNNNLEKFILRQFAKQIAGFY